MNTERDEVPQAHFVGERGRPRNNEELSKEDSIELLKQLLATLHDYNVLREDYEKYKDFSVHPSEIDGILSHIKQNVHFHDYNKIYLYLKYCEELILRLNYIKESITYGMKNMMNHNHLKYKDGLISFSTSANLDE